MNYNPIDLTKISPESKKVVDDAGEMPTWAKILITVILLIGSMLLGCRTVFSWIQAFEGGF